MYVWKVWFRVTDPLPGLPWVQDVQCHAYTRTHRCMLPAHLTAGSWRALAVESGTLRFTGDGGMRVLLPGDAILLDHGGDWSLDALDPGGPCRFRYASLMAADAPCAALRSRDRRIASLGLESGPIRHLESFRPLYDKVVRANPARRGQTPVFPLAPAEAFRLAADLLAAWIAGVPAEADGGDRQRAEALVQRARDYQHATRRFDLAVGDLAQQLGCSRKHLAWAFRSAGLHEPSRWLRGLRIEEARRRLAAGAAVSEVAGDLGFSSPSNFARALRAATGRSPQELRGRN